MPTHSLQITKWRKWQFHFQFLSKCTSLLNYTTGSSEDPILLTRAYNSTFSLLLMHTKTVQLQKARLMKSIAFGSCLHGENMYKSYRLNKLTLLYNKLIQQKLFIAIARVLFTHVCRWTKWCTVFSVWQLDQWLNLFLASPNRVSSKLESQNELCHGDQVSKQWILILDYTNIILHNMSQKDKVYRGLLANMGNSLQMSG